jgi:hypothetical protein
MTSTIFRNEEVNLLHSLRARYTNAMAIGHWPLANLSSRYQNNIMCLLCKTERDDQPQILECSVLKTKFKSTVTLTEKPTYLDIFADHKKRKEIVQLFDGLLKIR